MQKLFGNFNGTGAAVYVCIGAVPTSVKVIDVEVATNSLFIEWNRAFLGSASAYGGILMTGSTGVYTKLTTAGVFPYEGGDLMTATNQTSTTYGEGIYLGWDTKDYRDDKTYGTTGAAIDTWNFVTGLTGYWNVAKQASGRIGVGSIVRIKEASSGLVKEASITAISSDGEVSAEVTLSRAIGSGKITFIGGMYQLAPIALGKVAPAGFLLNDTVVNVNDDTIAFVCEVNDNR